jgi:hypothetical protein
MRTLSRTCRLSRSALLFACPQFNQHVVQLPFSVRALVASTLQSLNCAALLSNFFPKREKAAFRTCCQSSLRRSPLPRTPDQTTCAGYRLADNW